MSWPQTLALLLLATPLAAAPSVVPAGADFSADAYCVRSGELLYRELHDEVWREGRIVGQSVGYYTPTGELFASKEIDYTTGAFSPTFELTDRRRGYREGARSSKRGVELYSGRGAVRSKEVSRPAAAVLDAGFHRYVQANLDRIIAGERLTFQFGVPALRRFVDFQIERSAVDRRDGEPVHRLTLRPAARLIRLFVDPIELTYDRAGRLLEFEGLSNISDAAGKSYVARIVFNYTAAATAGTTSLSERGLGR